MTDCSVGSAWFGWVRHQCGELYTRRNGWFLREEDQLGSILDTLADLVMLNSDYFAVPDEDLKKIRSVLTVVDGKIARHLLRGQRGHERTARRDA